MDDCWVTSWVAFGRLLGDCLGDFWATFWATFERLFGSQNNYGGILACKCKRKFGEMNPEMEKRVRVIFLVLMVQFSNPDASEWQILRCESIANAKGASWVTLFGWDEPSTSESIKTVGSVAPPASVASQASRPLPCPPPATIRKRSSRSLETIWDLPETRKKSRRGQEYISVSDLCTGMDTGDSLRKKKHLNEWMPKWANTFGWANSAWGSFVEFRSRSGGGIEGAGATFSACQDICKLCNRA